jgi:hypothetical protein
MKCYTCKNELVCKFSERWFKSLEKLNIFGFLSQDDGAKAILTLQSIYDKCKFFSQIDNENSKNKI